MNTTGNPNSDGTHDSSIFQPAQQCPNCGSEELYLAVTHAGAGGRAGYFSLLPGLGSFLSYPTFQIVLCSKCGCTQFFADPESRAKAAKASGWQKLVPSVKPIGFTPPPPGTVQQGIDPGQNEWQTFTAQAIHALNAAGIQVGNEIRGGHVLLIKANIWLDLGGYFEQRANSDCISRMVERALELSRD